LDFNDKKRRSRAHTNVEPVSFLVNVFWVEKDFTSRNRLYSFCYVPMCEWSQRMKKAVAPLFHLFVFDIKNIR